MIPPPEQRKLMKLKRSQVCEDPEQPRKVIPIESVVGMADNIRQMGLLSPLIVCPIDPRAAKREVDALLELPSTPKYKLIDGHRRFRALGLVPLDEFDALVLSEHPSPDMLLAIQLSLGFTNERLNPVDLADGIQRLMLLKRVSQAEMSTLLGISTPQLSKLLAINEGLASSVKEDVKAGLIGFSYAAALARIQDIPTQVALAEKVKGKLLSRDALEYEVKRFNQNGKAKRPKPLKVKDREALLQVPGDWTWQQINGWIAKLAEGVRKGMRNNLPPGSLPGLM